MSSIGAGINTGLEEIKEDVLGKEGFYFFIYLCILTFCKVVLPFEVGTHFTKLECVFVELLSSPFPGAFFKNLSTILFFKVVSFINVSLQRRYTKQCILFIYF